MSRRNLDLLAHLFAYALVVYLAGSFIAGSFDIYQGWNLVGRIAATLCWAVMSLVWIGDRRGY